MIVNEDSSEGDEYWEEHEEESEESLWTMENGKQVLILKGIMKCMKNLSHHYNM